MAHFIFVGGELRTPALGRLESGYWGSLLLGAASPPEALTCMYPGPLGLKLCRSHHGTANLFTAPRLLDPKLTDD